MWKTFKCRLFGDHDYQLCREPTALFLQCRRCGRRSRGWNLSEKRVSRADSPLRLFIAEPGDTVRAMGVSDRIGSEMLAALLDADELRLTFGQED